jgi:D-3-phosphoglycerate dehydrogenase
MIGKVGSILGGENVNISFMTVGRTGRRKTAVVAIGVDDEPNSQVLHKIQSLPAVEELVYLKLSN